jgi:hypothetical protein
MLWGERLWHGPLDRCREGLLRVSLISNERVAWDKAGESECFADIKRVSDLEMTLGGARPAIALRHA